MATPKLNDPFGVVSTLETSAGPLHYYSLEKLAKLGLGDIASLPVSIKVLLESALRNVDDFIISQQDVKNIAAYDAADPAVIEVPFMPARVLLQDFTGVPAVVDLASLREACKALGGDPRKINPLVKCDLVIDHSVQVDYFGNAAAFGLNAKLEFERNKERYEFLKWGQQAFNNFSVVPPDTGIVHQVNLEYLAQAVMVDRNNVALPDSLVGTDSHTTMINGLGVVGWGVGGIEAEAVMLGQPIYMLLPKVTGFKLTGKLPAGATATDLVLTCTQMLRKAGVVGQFVEYFGDGLDSLSLADRATIANMAPEYGATVGFFPIDDVTLEYMRLTGRPAAVVERTEKYAKAQGLWRVKGHTPRFSRTLELDLSTIEPSLAGPKRPQDRIPLTAMKSQWKGDLSNTFKKPLPGGSSGAVAAEGGVATATAVAVADPGYEGVQVTMDGQTFTLKHGSVVIAAITSCTNTSNPALMIGAALVARNARRKGLLPKPWVKTSIAPGSRVTEEYYKAAGLLEDLDAMRFNIVGYGCTTCIGNSGPLPEPISHAIQTNDLVAAAVLSGNRNFEGRINPDCKANYLASPPLVVAYALAGTVDIDLQNEPLGTGKDGKPVYLRDVWPSPQEVEDVVKRSVTAEQFSRKYADVFKGDDNWQNLPAATGDTYKWEPSSTYIANPPFFTGLTAKPGTIKPIEKARVLLLLGDSVTTDHISPAGSIKKDSPAGRWLIAHGVEPKDFNSYGARRGHHEVMMRGTFANIRLKNLLVPGSEGNVTVHLPTSQQMSIYDAAMKYKDAGVPLVILAGKEYGTGSSRDWAAKGTYLLGVHAVIAESFERIHRSNLVGMGVLPLQFLDGHSAKSIGLSGQETFDIEVTDHVKPLQRLNVTATDPATGAKKVFQVQCRIDTPVEVEYYRNGGILHTVVRKLASS
jgi:aconitate hydratase